MQTVTKKQYYTPAFSAFASISVRRFAWAAKKPMTQTVDMIIQLLPFLVESSTVCKVCQDKTKCDDCTFQITQLPPEKQLIVLENLDKFE